MNAEEIMDLNLPAKEHGERMMALKARQAEVMKDTTHKRLRSANGTRNQQVPMRERSYDVLKLIKQIRRKSTVGSVFDDLFSPNRNVREQSLAFMMDFCGKRLDDLFKYCKYTRTWEIDTSGLDVEYFNKMDEYGYTDS